MSAPSPKQSLRVALDARWIFPELSGIGVHTRELIRNLADVAPTDAITLLFHDPEIMARTLSETGTPFATECLPLDMGLFSLKNQLQLPGVLKAGGFDVYHSPNYMIPLRKTGVKTIVTIHDLIPIVLPDHAPKSKKSKIPGLFPWLLKRVARLSDQVVAVSEHTKSDLIHHLGVPPDQVSVIYNGVNPAFQPLVPQPPRDTTILYVGRFDPYKNLSLLVRAFAQLSAFPDHRLQIIGHPDPRYPEPMELARSLGVAERVDWLGAVSDQIVLERMQRAAVLVLPSRYEGFGLPVLEAMACGTPVVCSRSSSLPEIAGPAAEYIDLDAPDPATDCAAAITRVLRSHDPEKTRLGLERAKTFDWATTARQTWALYQSCTACSFGETL